MRLATFNLESLDLPPRAHLGIEERALLLRPALLRLDADILCLQEVNGQRVEGHGERVLEALRQLLAGTRYETFHLAHTSGKGGTGAADVHNLVTLSRFPIVGTREVRHDLVPAADVRLLTAEPASVESVAAVFERPMLLTDIDWGGEVVSVVNVHLRAPLAASIPGQKLAPFVWRTIAGWAEGYHLAAMKRTAQALELRLLVESLMDADPSRLVAVAGDFNAEDHETPLKIAVGAQEDTGNGALAARSLVILDRALAADRRWSVLHHGRPLMLDHVLASHALFGRFQGIEVHNEALGDEAIAYARVDRPPGSSHAGLVVTFKERDTAVRPA